MTTTVPARGPLTDALFEHLDSDTTLSARGVLVGDGAVPTAAGWTDPQPGKGEFIASVTLTTLEASPLPHPETVRSRHTSWRCLYGMKAIGGARTQADHAADVARKAAVAFPRGEMDLDGPWEVTDVICTRLAPVVRVDPTDAPTFEVQDLIEVWITRKTR